MIFIDADKENYKNYYNSSLELLKKWIYTYRQCIMEG